MVSIITIIAKIKVIMIVSIMIILKIITTIHDSNAKFIALVSSACSLGNVPKAG